MKIIKIFKKFQMIKLILIYLEKMNNFYFEIYYMISRKKKKVKSISF